MPATSRHAEFSPQPVELVVLCDDDGTPQGTADKSTVHHADTPLHLAFSCHLLNDDGQVLLSRRALSKTAWPGVWTNSFCGHPAPGESLPEAVARRAKQELGADIAEITEVLPDFRYRAVDDSGVVENEICPVFTARLIGELQPNPEEVCAVGWCHPDEIAAVVRSAPFTLSPWLVLQVPHLALYQSSKASNQ